MSAYTVCTVVISTVSRIFQTHGIFFVLYFLLNVIDLATVLIKRRLLKTTSGKSFEKIVFKKILCWLMLAVAFGISVVFIQIGKVINADLGVSSLLGWFVLGSLMLNDLRYFLQNLLDCGVQIPGILRKTLVLAEKALDEPVQYDGTIYIDGDLSFDVVLDEDLADLSAQDSVVLKVSNEVVET